MIVTLKRLEEFGACAEGRERFRELCGESCTVTEKLCVEHATEFNWDWAACRFLPVEAWAEYDKAWAPTWEGYKRACVAALAEYDKTRKAAYAEYRRVVEAAYAEHRRVEEYQRARAAAWAEYTRARTAARAEYSRIRAADFGRLAEAVE